ncbi:hypothetical protein PSTT_12914 [Puccinia striiformis]|uniref:Uncharacterized protein n=1 Tax=Puccinia striiformis TaxID=27350 RepID=A0A2S4UU25_9BASI|nr:hypothetical protein PSTT_12914 [Puccinia striiformis]
MSSKTLDLMPLTLLLQITSREKGDYNKHDSQADEQDDGEGGEEAEGRQPNLGNSKVVIALAEESSLSVRSIDWLLVLISMNMNISSEILTPSSVLVVLVLQPPQRKIIRMAKINLQTVLR